jgi:predicted Zn finger-like uncharacterized protein
MKIVCDSCSTKYSISDDKVRGKVFKIRCKKCSHIIVVRGNGEGAPASVEAPSDAVWHLVVDGDQVGPLAEAEVRARLSRGEISAENYVWKEGFSDWLRLVDVPEFADVAPAAAPASAAGDLFADSTPAPTTSRASARHAAVVEQEPFFSAGSTASAPEAVGGSARASSGRVRAPAEAVAAAVAAVPDEDDAFSIPAAVPRASDGADLFGAAPLAARAESGRTKTRGSNGSARHDGGRVENLTAQRSENSVLFSLSNLQSLAAPAATARPSSSSGSPSTEGSGLIDIRAMAASTLRGPSLSSGGPLSFGGEGARSAADDLPTFGAFSSAAPVLFPLPSSSGPPKWIYALIALAAVLVIAVFVAAVGILRKPMIVEQVPAPAPVAAAPVAAAPAPKAARTMAENELPPREGKGTEPSTGDKGSDKTGGDKGAHAVAHHPIKAAGKKGGPAGTGDSRSSGESGSGASSDRPAAESDKPKPTKGSLDDLLEGALSNKARARANQDESGGNGKRGSDSSGGGAGGPLAKGAVVAGMNGVKGKVSACYTQFKVPGMAMVNVVISKSGKVTSATVTGKFAGTPTGTCVENAVRSASFPASDGLTTPYPFNLR